MPIVLVRIDERLIHGQIIVGWVKFLKARVIIVADDEIEKNAFRLEAMKIAVPPSISVEVYNVSQAVERYLHHEFPDKEIILLFPRLKDFKRSLDLGFKTAEVNLGCIHSGEEEILSNIAIQREEVFYLKEIQKRGILMEVSALPPPTPDKKIYLRSIPRYQELIREK